MQDGRPDPQALLRRVAAPPQGGRLKVFLGYCAGVGKTFAMLEAAQREQTLGRKVWVGWVETHGRAETQQLLEGLPVLAPRQVSHKGLQIQEFDLDACLETRPELVLVDELAHTNAPDSRHPKRYQDIQELLEAGIDVFTCLNVQHLESLNDAVFQITGVRVRETVPDQVLSSARIELVDLPSEELLLRLQEGKVYAGPKAGQAAQNFFRPGNLVALRELAMRCAAQQVDQEVNRYMRQRSISGPWPVCERLLVAVGPSPLSARLVRAAKRLSVDLKAEWLAVSVDTGQKLSPDARERVAAHLRLAASLGATTDQVTGQEVPSRLIEYARQQNVTKIVAGKPTPGKLWQKFLPDLVDKLIALSGDIDVYVISSEPWVAPRTRSNAPGQSSAYVWSTIWVAVITLCICWPASRYLSATNLIMAYLALVCSIAARLGRGPAFWASALSVATFDFLFVPPYLTFHVDDTQYLLTFVAFLGVSLFISTLTSRVGNQAEAARRREGQTLALLDLSRDLSVSRGTAEVSQALSRHLQRHLDPKAGVYLELPSDLDPALRAVADWAWQKCKPAGRHSQTLPEAAWSCLPIVASDQILGLVVMQRSQSFLPAEQELLDSFLIQAAAALERLQLAELAQQAEVLRATEKLQTALLNSVSHDLKIPLVSIKGALQAVAEEVQVPLSDEERQLLLENALQETDRLNRLVGNLLQMSQLESGALQVQCQPHEVSDLLAGLQVQTVLPDDLPLVSCDVLLTQQVLRNLIDNARKYAQSEPRIEVETDGKVLTFSVIDDGPGIPPEERSKVFEPFYRVKSPSVAGGSGLGLSICQGLIESQGGRIWIDGPLTGCRVRFCLPIASLEVV
jgi:two-component system sensor histidine kinase KdpD